jgi:hypothetical protein
MDVGDQAGCFGKPRRGEKIGCRRENVDRITERSHEPAHGLTKELIIFNDRNEYLFHHAVRWTRPRADNYPTILTLRIELLDIRENATSVPRVPRKLWFIWTMSEANPAWLMIDASAGRKRSRDCIGRALGLARAP